MIITETRNLFVDCDHSWGPSYGKTVWWEEKNEPWWATKPCKTHVDINRERVENLYVELMRRPVR